MQKVDLAYLQTIYTSRNQKGNKGTFGHSLIIAGSTNRMGAALISAKACLKSGVGLLSVMVPEEERLVVHLGIPEAMITPRVQDKYDFSKYKAIGIGPALYPDENIFLTVLENFTSPIVIDADAISMLSVHVNWWRFIPSQSIITPHPKEFDRVFGDHDSVDSRIQTAVNKSKDLNIIIVLKGDITYVVDKEDVFLCDFGNSSLAKGGSGDALTGLITGFLTQSYSPIYAALLGVYIQGQSAVFASEIDSEDSVLISDIINQFGKSFRRLQLLTTHKSES